MECPNDVHLRVAWDSDPERAARGLDGNAARKPGQWYKSFNRARAPPIGGREARGTIVASRTETTGLNKRIGHRIADTAWVVACSFSLRFKRSAPALGSPRCQRAPRAPVRPDRARPPHFGGRSCECKTLVSFAHVSPGSRSGNGTHRNNPLTGGPLARGCAIVRM
jgi:hypothetical protein